MADSFPTSLDTIGVAEGTDKSSLVGDYLRHYDRFFSYLRHETFNMIEIGVFRGASSRMWRRYFESAQIIGVDIDPACRQYAADRVKIEIGSQSDPEFLHQLAAKYPPLVIIDDGSHRSEDIIFSFERLFPALLPGGWYIVEDVHFHFLPHEVERLRGNSNQTAVEYLAAMMTDRMRSNSDLAGLTGLHRYIIESIDSICVIPQAVAIRKSARQSNDYFVGLRSLIESSTRGEDWFHYGMRLRERGWPAAQIIEVLDRAVQLAPRDVIFRERLADVHFEAGDRERAAKVLESAVASIDVGPHLAGILAERAAAYRGG